MGRCGSFHVLVITANNDIIRQDELEEIDTDSIGSDVFGNCFLRKLKRLGINVVDKQLVENNIHVLYKEALFMQTFSHRCIPLLLGIQLE